jgi:hypothetical protein
MHRLPGEGSIFSYSSPLLQGSLVGSTSLAAMIALHLARGTWVNKVDRFIALTNFARNLFIKAGLPAKRSW